MEQFVSLLVIVTGALALSLGVMFARDRVRLANRAYQRTEALFATMPEGWHSWYLGAFSSLSVGMRWLFATGAWLIWTIAGTCLIVLGIRLFGKV